VHEDEVEFVHFLDGFGETAPLFVDHLAGSNDFRLVGRALLVLFVEG
jgi:hypothetical protein